MVYASLKPWFKIEEKDIMPLPEEEPEIDTTPPTEKALQGVINFYDYVDEYRAAAAAKK